MKMTFSLMIKDRALDRKLRDLSSAVAPFIDSFQRVIFSENTHDEFHVTIASECMQRKISSKDLKYFHVFLPVGDVNQGSCVDRNYRLCQLQRWLAESLSTYPFCEAMDRKKANEVLTKWRKLVSTQLNVS